jgi:hypothetical protein
MHGIHGFKVTFLLVLFSITKPVQNFSAILDIVILCSSTGTGYFAQNFW